MTQLAQKLRRSNEVVGLLSTPKLSTNSIQTLLSHAKEFEAMSDVCLVVLHLEVRLHCLYHLSPLVSGPSGAHFHGGPDSTDPSPEVTRLNADLLAAEEVLTASLDERKVAYVFDGLSHLCATLLIDAAPNVRKINSNGIKKMCRNVFSVQHTLATVSASSSSSAASAAASANRDNSLNMAKQYYEMLNNRPQVEQVSFFFCTLRLDLTSNAFSTVKDMLNDIMEKGPIFTHEQYKRALELLHRSDPNSTPELHKRYAAKLAEIIKRIGVTV